MLTSHLTNLLRASHLKTDWFGGIYVNFVLTRMPGTSCRRRFESSLFCPYDVFRALLTPFTDSKSVFPHFFFSHGKRKPDEKNENNEKKKKKKKKKYRE